MNKRENNRRKEVGGNWGRSEINRGKDLDKIIKKKRGNVWEKKELGPEGEGMRQSGEKNGG